MEGNEVESTYRGESLKAEAFLTICEACKAIYSDFNGVKFAD